MSRTDAVSPELAAEVFARDGNACMAPRLGGTMHDCWGTLGCEHVKKEPRMGQRASIFVDGVRRAHASVLVTLCEGHREPGTKAGYCWATAKENRERCREYLRAFQVNA